MNNLFDKLIKIANLLDVSGHIKEADAIDYLLLKIAMSIEDARILLSVSPHATEEEIQKAWRQKALANHPDRGGDLEMMKRVNIARDVLLEEKSGHKTIYKEPSEYKEPREYRPQQKERIEKVISLNDAIKSANIPDNVMWKFITEAGYGENLSGHQSGRVAYGITPENTMVFVGIYNYTYNNAFENKHVDTWDIFTRIMPKHKDSGLATVAPEVIREMWSKFNDVSGYNAKVKLLDQDIELRAAVWDRGRSISFKDAMDLMGEETPERWADRKIKVVMELGKSSWSDIDAPQPVTLIINGRAYELSTESCMKAKRAGLSKFIFGPYIYDDLKKDITRMPKEKAAKVFSFILKHMAEFEPKELMDAIEKALQQVTK